MYRLKNVPVDEPVLPKGYSFSNFKDCDKDKSDWLEICKNGLEPDDANESNFKRRIYDKPDCVPEKDIFFLDFNSEHIGTVTAIFHPNGNFGEIHMVSIRTDFRGKGLVKYLNNVAVKKLGAQNVDYIFLTTDEWRKSAVKSYFSAGFVPVNYDEGMKERWEAMMGELSIADSDMLNEDCSFFAKLHGKAVK